MESSATARILIVANRTAATPALIEAVRARAAETPSRFTLLVPGASHGLDRLTGADQAHDEPDEASAVLELALPLLEDAAGGEVHGMTGDSEPLAAIEDAVNRDDFDEIIISTLPARVSRWLGLDLVSKAKGLGPAVTHVEATGRRS